MAGINGFNGGLPPQFLGLDGANPLGRRDANPFNIGGPGADQYDFQLGPGLEGVLNQLPGGTPSSPLGQYLFFAGAKTEKDLKEIQIREPIMQTAKQTIEQSLQQDTRSVFGNGGGGQGG